MGPATGLDLTSVLIQQLDARTKIRLLTGCEHGPQRLAVSAQRCAELVQLARTAAEGSGQWTAPCTCAAVHTREVHPCSRTSQKGTCYVSAGCSAPELKLGTNSTRSMCSALQHFCDGSQVSKASRRRFSRDPGLTELPLRTSSFFYRASLRTGCEPHWPGDALRHLGSETQAGPGTAPYCVRWPSPSKVWFHRMALGQLFGSWKKGPRSSHRPLARQHSAISLPIVSHMIAAGRSLPLSMLLDGVEVWSAPGCVPGLAACFCASLPVPAPLSPPGRHTG